MGQKASLLSHHERQNQRGGSLHISSQANRRREAFKSAKKAHFSFGDEPFRHSIHHRESSGNQSSRRHKPSTIATTSNENKTFSPSQSITTPEKEFNLFSLPLSTNRPTVTCQRSFNNDFSALLNIPEPSHEFSIFSNVNRSQSPVDSVNRGLHASSCSHQSNIKLSEDEDICSEHSNPNYKNSPLLSLSRAREKYSPSQSPHGGKQNMDSMSSRTQVKLVKSQRSSSPKLVTVKSVSSDTHKGLSRSNLSGDSPKSFQSKDRSEKCQPPLPPPPLSKKRQTMVHRNSSEAHKTIDLSQENLVAALLPPSPLSQREKKISIAPHKLSPYNLSPRSLSPSQMSLYSLTSGNSNVYLSKDTGHKGENILANDYDFQNSFNTKSKVGFSVTPDIIINSASFKKSFDYSPEDTEISQTYERKSNEPQNASSSNTQFYRESKSSIKIRNTHDFYLFGSIGGDLFSINSKSDTSLSSVSFHKTPSIGLSPTAERGGLSNFFISENKFQTNQTSHDSVNKMKDYNQGLEKSLSMEYFKAKSTINYPTDDKIKHQHKREKEQDNVSKHQKVGQPRRLSLISQIVWPRSVPEELNSLSCLDFQGHQLLSWLCHWCGPHFKSGQKSDLYLLGCQMCTCLIACHQLISGRSSIGSVNSETSNLKIFQPEQMYRWNTSFKDLQDEDIDSIDKKTLGLTKINKNCNRCQLILQEIHKRDLGHSYNIQRLKQEQELEIFKVKNEGVMKMCQLNDKVEQLERQVEKYRILAGIEGLARQMWHEEALTANPNLVISKSPTLQSIGTNSGSIKPLSSTKSCSTDTSDLNENCQIKSLDEHTKHIPYPINIFPSPFPYTSNSSSNTQVSGIESNIKLKPLIGENETTVAEEKSKAKSIHISSNLQENSSTDICESLLVDQSSAISLESLISSKIITADVIKKWLDLQIPVENIDNNILKTFQEMIPNNAEITNNNKTDSKNMNSNFLTAFWNDLNLVPHLEEKVQFIHLYKTHIHSVQILDFKMNQFYFVAHFLENSESLINFLSLLMEICNLKSAENSSPSFPLNMLKQLKNMHLQSDGNSVLSIALDRYIQIYTKLSPSEYINFPLPEPNDFTILTNEEMGIDQFLKDLSNIEETIKIMNHISRCILSCSRQTFSVSDIGVYSSKLVDIIKKAQNEVIRLKQHISQCEKQYSNLQDKFTTKIESRNFFYQWLEFAKELKSLWILNISKIRRLQKESSDKINLKPVGKIPPRRINEEMHPVIIHSHRENQSL